MARAPARQSMGFGQLFGGMRGTPPIILVMICATVLLSIVAAAGARHGFPLAAWGALIPSEVVHGQLWRLFTWPLFELTSPLSLAFACLMLFWFGRDLATRWGALRFTGFYFGLATVVGVITVLVSRVYPAISGVWYLGSWPLQEAIIILWASFYPARQILLYFILPVGGRSLVLITIMGTVLFTIYYGIEMFIPHFIAEGLALIIFALPTPSEVWAERRLRSLEQKRKATHLRSVPRDRGVEPGDDTPPGPRGDGPSNGRWLN